MSASHVPAAEAVGAASGSEPTKRIAVFHTGGTIAMRQGATGEVSLHDDASAYLAEHVPPGIELQVVQPFNLPSPHITPTEMDALRASITEVVTSGQVDGVVVTHGTDTLEETAYYLDLTVPTDVPVVVTGAMRSANAIGADGLPNFVSAVTVAANDAARGMGTLVVLNEEIHAASYVTKTHTTNVATFQSPGSGPVGLVTTAGVSVRQRPVHREVYPITGMHQRVALLKSYAGMSSEIFVALAELGIGGLVIEALGAGNLPPAVLPGIDLLLSQGVPVVITSRCFNGITEAVYSYEGGGVDLARRGCILSNGVNGQKARLKLSILLEAGLTRDQIAEAFRY